MKRHLYLMLIVMACLSASKQNHTYIAKILHPDATDPLTQLRGLYQGEILNFSDGLAVLPIGDFCSHFCLVITPEVVAVHDDVAPHFELKPGLTCAWYDLTCVFEEGRMSWKIERQETDAQAKRIPNDALILLFDPSFLGSIVDTIYAENKSEQKTSSIIHLPTVQMKTNLTPEERKRLEDSLTRSLLAQCDLAAYHTPVERVVQKAHSMTQCIRTSCAAR